MSTIADEIKRTLSMDDVARYYGFQLTRSNSIKCPFHNDKTASLKIYSEPGRGWHCYGACNDGGSVIDFVMKLYGLPFREACVRLNSDFHLGLTDDKPDPRETERRNREREEAEQRRAIYEAEYMAHTLRYRKLWAAKMAGYEHPDYAAACHELPALDYYFDTHPWKDR